MTPSRFIEIYDAGAEAAELAANGVEFPENPYKPGSQEYYVWEDGYESVVNLSSGIE